MSDLKSRIAALEARLDKIASKMLLKQPFIGAVFVKLPRKVTVTGTAATNGHAFFFSVEFCEPLTDDELFGLALHEALHVVMMHSWRRGSRDPALFNIATDAWINFSIKAMGYSLPANGVSIDWVNDDWDAEGIYRKLQQQQPDGPSGRPCPDGTPSNEQGTNTGSGGGDADDPAGDPADSVEDSNSQGSTGDEAGANTGGGGWDGQGDLGDAHDEASQADIEAAIVTAARVAKAAGKGNKFTDMVLAGNLEPSVNWHDALRYVFGSNNRDDYTFARTNKRFVSQGIYIPALWTEAIGGLIVGFDTSASMSQDELEMAAAEITAIFEDCRPEWVEVVYCSTSITHTQRFYPGDNVVLEAKGRGGTAFKPVFDYASELGEPIAALVYFTDMEGNMHEIDAPDYPVIWANTNLCATRNVPFGDVIRVAA
jgi:predicted metal-dependent peptidase